MKKSIYIIIFLTGFLAFACCPGRSGSFAKPVVKTVKKKMNLTAISPLADLALLPALNG